MDTAETETRPAPQADPADAASTATASAACAACGELLAGPYCYACGERAPRPGDESLAAFLREQFHEVTSADGRLWRTVRALFVPGKLTDEYLGGRRGLYARPVRIFLVANVALFFALSGSDGTLLKGPLTTHFGAALYGDAARTMTDERAERWGVPADEFEAAFDRQASALAPSLVGVLIPAFALLLAVTTWWADGSGVRHVVLATHTVAAFIALTFVLMLALELALAGVRWAAGNPRWADSMDPVLIPLMGVTFVVYLGAAVRRVYGVPVWAAAAVGVVLGTVGFAFAFWCFRLVLFFVTLWTLDPPI